MNIKVIVWIRRARCKKKPWMNAQKACGKSVWTEKSEWWPLSFRDSIEIPQTKGPLSWWPLSPVLNFNLGVNLRSLTLRAMGLHRLSVWETRTTPPKGATCRPGHGSRHGSRRPRAQLSTRLSTQRALRDIYHWNKNHYMHNFDCRGLILGSALAERILRGFLGFCRRIFSPHFFCGKVPRKILQENPWQNPPNVIQQKSLTQICRGAGPNIISAIPQHISYTTLIVEESICVCCVCISGVSLSFLYDTTEATTQQ